MSTGIKFIASALLAMLAFAASASSSLAQEPQPTYSPEGAWFCYATIVGFPRAIPFMDIYTADSSRPAVSGTVLCTLALKSFASPMGTVSLTHSAHGNWVRIEKNRYAVTAWRILVDVNGKAVGTAKFWGVLAMDGADEFSATMNAEYYDGTGISFATFEGTTTGKRIEIEGVDAAAGVLDSQPRPNSFEWRR